MKRAFFLVVCLFGFIFLNGCSTLYNTARGFGQGVAEDSRFVWEKIVEADKWVDKNTW